MEKCQLLTNHRYVGEKLSSDKSDKRFWNTFHLRNCHIKLITIALKRLMQHRRVQKLGPESTLEMCLTLILLMWRIR